VCLLVNTLISYIVIYDIVYHTKINTHIKHKHQHSLISYYLCFQHTHNHNIFLIYSLIYRRYPPDNSNWCNLMDASSLNDMITWPMDKNTLIPPLSYIPYITPDIYHIFGIQFTFKMLWWWNGRHARLKQHTHSSTKHLCSLCMIWVCWSPI